MRLSGHLMFKPDRGPGFKKAHKLSTLILDLPKHKSLPYYYLNMLERELGPWSNLAVPMFGVHVTVIRSNGDRFDEAKLHALNSQPMTVIVDPTKLERTPWSGANPGFWTMSIVSEELENLRAKLGVKPIFPYRPHLTVARENLSFFMHVRWPADPLKAAKNALNLIPARGGNIGLQQDLRGFINGFYVNPLSTARELVALVYKHLSFPSRDWEHELLNLFNAKVLS